VETAPGIVVKLLYSLEEPSSPLAGPTYRATG